MDELEQKRILSRFYEIVAIEPITAIEYLKQMVKDGLAGEWAVMVIGSGLEKASTLIVYAGQCLNRQIEELSDITGR